MMTMILRRLAALPFILLIIYTITLTLAWAVPGNPLENPEKRPKPEVIEQMKKQEKTTIQLLDGAQLADMGKITGV